MLVYVLIAVAVHISRLIISHVELQHIWLTNLQIVRTHQIHVARQ